MSTSLIRFAALPERTGLSRSEIYRRLAANPQTFPAPIIIRGTRTRAWSSDDIENWVTAEIAAAALSDGSLNKDS